MLEDWKWERKREQDLEAESQSEGRKSWRDKIKETRSMPQGTELNSIMEKTTKAED